MDDRNERGVIPRLHTMEKVTLDKIKFAELVAWICTKGAHLDVSDIQDLDRIVASNTISTDEVVNMLKAMNDGRKIDAIRSVRTLTGLDVLDAKILIEGAMEHNDNKVPF